MTKQTDRPGDTLPTASARSKMVRVFTAPQFAMANVVKTSLLQAGICAEVRGEQLGSLAGAIPIDQAFAHVWVREEDVDAARALVATHAAMGDDEVRCRDCGQENPEHFGSCWNCDASLDGASAVETDAPQTAATSTAAVFSMPTVAPQRSLSWMVSASLLTTTILFCALWLQTRHDLTRALGEGRFVSTWDQDDACLETVDRQTGALASRSCDFNRDANFEQIDIFDDEGVLISRTFDRDEDGYEDIGIDVTCEQIFVRFSGLAKMGIESVGDDELHIFDRALNLIAIEAHTAGRVQELEISAVLRREATQIARHALAPYWGTPALPGR